MTLISLQALTWSTVTGVVVSALMLASGEPGMNQPSSPQRPHAAPRAAPLTPAWATQERPVVTKVVAPLSEGAMRREVSAR